MTDVSSCVIRCYSTFIARTRRDTTKSRLARLSGPPGNVSRSRFSPRGGADAARALYVSFGVRCFVYVLCISGQRAKYGDDRVAARNSMAVELAHILVRTSYLKSDTRIDTCGARARARRAPGRPC